MFYLCDLLRSKPCYIYVICEGELRVLSMLSVEEKTVLWNVLRSSKTYFIYVIRELDRILSL